MKKDNLGDRMKGYEYISRTSLTRRMPVIIRLDGKAFHTFARGFVKPFDKILTETMWETAKFLCENIQGCKMAYAQSDEITLLLVDYENIDSCAWFDNNIQKMVSVSASMATLAFNRAFTKITIDKMEQARAYDFLKGRNEGCNFDYFFVDTKDEDGVDWKKYEKYLYKFDTAMFDSRVFTIPKEEVVNCFLWRQQDATRNSIQSVGQANFSQEQLKKRNCNMIQDMLWSEKNINWNDFPTYQKRGACIVKEMYEVRDKNGENFALRRRWVVDKDIPIFSKDRSYIEKYV